MSDPFHTELEALLKKGDWETNIKLVKQYLAKIKREDNILKKAANITGKPITR